MIELCLSKVDCPSRDEVDVCGGVTESNGVDADLCMIFGAGLCRALRF